MGVRFAESQVVLVSPLQNDKVLASNVAVTFISSRVIRNVCRFFLFFLADWNRIQLNA